MGDHGVQIGRQVDDGDGIELESEISHFRHFGFEIVFDVNNLDSECMVIHTGHFLGHMPHPIPGLVQ
jgi:hypothetical protein